MARTVIALKGMPIISEEGSASEAITPGHLVQGVTTIDKHATALGFDGYRFAMERDELGDTVSDAYASGDVVKVGSFAPGDRVYAWLASGENVSIEAQLESAGDGQLQAYTSGSVVAIALEAVNASSADSRIRVELV